MSTVTSPVRVRAPRLTGAIEKARLTLVPTRRVQAPRAPFAVLVFAILGLGVVGLLMFNTHMQQASFYATKLQTQADDLTARQQKLDMELDALRDPQHLAAAAERLHMVAPGVPAFVELGTRRVVGTPTVASSADGVPINPQPAKLPPPLVVNPIIVKVHVPAKTQANPQTPTGQASPPATPTKGKKKTPKVD